MFGRATFERAADGSQIGHSFNGWWSKQTTRSINAPGSAISSTTAWTFDTLGRVISVVEPSTHKADGSLMNLAETTTYRYDPFDRVILATKEGSGSSGEAAVTQSRVQTYDDFGWLVSETSPEVPIHEVRSRDSLGNPTKEATGATVLVHAWDPSGRLLSSTAMLDATNPYEQFYYDSVPPSFGLGVDTGRSNGRLVLSIRRNHVATSQQGCPTCPPNSDLGWVATQDLYHYAGLGGRLGFRQLQTIYLDGSPASGPPSPAANPAAADKPAFQNSLRAFFDSTGRTEKTMVGTLTGALAAPVPAASLAAPTTSSPYTPSGWIRWAYEFDGAGRLQRLTYPRRDEGNATQVNYSYDAGLPVSATMVFRDPFTPTAPVETAMASLTYNPSGTLESTTISHGVNWHNTIFAVTTPDDPWGLARPASWSVSVAGGAAAGIVETRPYAYDGSGNIVQAGSATYGYDERNRLRVDSLPWRAVNPASREYDGFGNLTRVVRPASQDLFTTDRTTNRITGPGTFEYDNDHGRLKYDGPRELQRDWYPDGAVMAEYQHVPGTTLGLPTGMSAYPLDARGERAFIWWAAWGDGCTNELLRDVARDESGRVLTDYMAEPLTTPCYYSWAERYKKDYVWIGSQALVTYQRGEGMRYAALSPLGTPEYVFDSNWSTVGRTLLNSFGTDLGSTGTERHRFTGHERSHVVGGDGTSLPMADYMHARDYVPVLSRFASPDPLNKFSLFDPQSFNRYAYVLNDPVNKFDPFGLEDEDRKVSVKATVEVIGEDPDRAHRLFMIRLAYGDAFARAGRGAGAGSFGQQLPGASPNRAVPANPCQYAGHALPPSAYAARGQAAKWNPFTALQDLRSFQRGGALDAQPMTGAPPLQAAAYGNYVYGVWMAASGTPLWAALLGGSGYALFSGAQYPGRTMDPTYGWIPADNVANITNGYGAQMNGTTCDN